MLIYTDTITGDELLSDSFDAVELFNGVLWEVQGKWVVQGALEIDIGANPSAEGGDEEGVEDQAQKVVDVVDTFRLYEQSAYDKPGFMSYIKGYIKKLAATLPADKAEHFKANVQDAVKFLLSKIKDLQFFVGESMNSEGGMVYAYYKDGATDPTFLYFKDGLKEVKC